MMEERKEEFTYYQSIARRCLDFGSFEPILDTFRKSISRGIDVRPQIRKMILELKDFKDRSFDVEKSELEKYIGNLEFILSEVEEGVLLDRSENDESKWPVIDFEKILDTYLIGVLPQKIGVIERMLPSLNEETQQYYQKILDKYNKELERLKSKPKFRKT
jgi:hypothetical protein